MLGNQADFRPDCDYINQMFAFRQALEHEHPFQRPSMVLFLT